MNPERSLNVLRVGVEHQRCLACPARPLLACRIRNCEECLPSIRCAVIQFFGNLGLRITESTHALGPLLDLPQVEAAQDLDNSRRGAFWRAFVDHHGPDAKDPTTIFLQSPTRVMNPTIDPSLIEKDLLRDEPRARAEWLAEFRRDIEGYVSREAIEAVVVPGRRELPPVERVPYSAFVDPSGGSSDSMTLAVCHAQDEVLVVDAVRERRPPFNPSEVVKEFAQLLKHYGVSRVEGDRYAGEWPRERFAEHGIHYEVTRKPKNDIYLQALPLINSGQVELLDDPRLIAQLCDLERRTARGGRESIDHPPRGHDDLANRGLGEGEGGIST